MSLVILTFWLTPRLEEVRMCVTFKIANQILNCINEGQVQCPKLEGVWKFSCLGTTVKKQ